MKNLLTILFMASLFTFGCSNNKTNKTETTQSSTEACAPSITVDSFMIIAANNVGKELTIMGTIEHVCKHGGKRVKIFSSCPSKFIHGEASENMGSFAAELEGSDVCLTGIVLETKVDMTYVEEWETKLNKAISENAEESSMEHKKGIDHHAKLEEIKNYRKEIEASETGSISFYSLEVSKYTECKKDCGNDSEKPCCAKAKEEPKPCCSDSVKESKETLTAPCGDKVEAKACCGDKSEAKDKPCQSEK